MNVSALASTVALTAMLAIPAMAQDRPRTLGNGVAPMATTDPQIMIYRIPGVASNTSINQKVATSFSCYSNSATTENIRIRVFSYDSYLLWDYQRSILSKRTMTFSTRDTLLFYEDGTPPSVMGIEQGSAAIIATSKEIYCSAMIVDAGSVIPSGVALHMVRFNPAPGSVE